MLEYKTSIISPYCDFDYYFASHFAMHLCQETVGRMGAAYKCDIPTILKDRKTWMVLSSSIEFFYKPFWMSEIVLEGHYYSPKGHFVPRRVKARMANGEYAFKSDSIWAVASVEENNVHKIIDPNLLIKNVRVDQMSDGEPFAPRFKRMNLDGVQGERFCVKHRATRSDCDGNLHVNNLKYVEWIVGYIDDDVYKSGMDIRKLDICYAKELHENDEVEINYVKLSPSEYYVSVGDAAFAHLLYDKLPRIRF